MLHKSKGWHQESKQRYLKPICDAHRDLDTVKEPLKGGILAIQKYTSGTSLTRRDKTQNGTLT